VADKVRIGLIDCGNISPQYLEWCRIFEILDLVACADLYVTLAQESAEEFEVDRGCSGPGAAEGSAHGRCARHRFSAAASRPVAS